MKGRRLSVIQGFGLELLVRQDNIESAERFVDDYRLALLASGGDPVHLFSDYFPQEPQTVGSDEQEMDDVLRDDVALDLTGVDFEGVPDADEMALLEGLLSDNQVDIGPGDPGMWH
jgi:hypothetical protein